MLTAVCFSTGVCVGGSLGSFAEASDSVQSCMEKQGKASNTDSLTLYRETENVIIIDPFTRIHTTQYL